MLAREIFFRTARGGGKGGQNVNKVETMAEAWWHVWQSLLYNEEEKSLIADKLRNRINKEGYLIVRAADTRSQLENKHLAQQRLEELVRASLIRPRQRKPTRPSRSSVEKRLEHKRRDAEKKQGRRGNWL